jgi:hypothetical protein
VAEVGGVQVALEDLGLGDLLFQLGRETHLTDLATVGLLRRGDRLGRRLCAVAQRDPNVLHR